MAHPQEGKSQLHREFQDDLRSVSALTEIPQANRSDGTSVLQLIFLHDHNHTDGHKWSSSVGLDHVAMSSSEHCMIYFSNAQHIDANLRSSLNSVWLVIALHESGTSLRIFGLCTVGETQTQISQNLSPKSRTLVIAKQKFCLMGKMVSSRQATGIKWL